MKNSVGLLYERPKTPLEGEGLDKIVSLTNSIQEATTFVHSRYPGVELNIYYGGSPQEIYTALFKGKSGEEITKAVDGFIALTGVPYAVKGKYKLMDGIFEPYGKKLVRDLFSFGGGVQKFVRDVA